MTSTLSTVPCKVIVDAMGGDNAPLICVQGAVQAQKENSDIEVFLIGRKLELEKILKEQTLYFDPERIIDASEVIEMGDKPAEAIKVKKDSSIVRGCELIRSGKYDAFVSAGNTGAMMAASTFIIGRIAGISRATMGSFFPNESGITTIFDVGANVDSKPMHLLEFALMGSIFVREIYGITNPKIGLLSVGEEDSKGNKVTLETFALLKKTNLNFIGNIEGRDILKGTVHIVLCDGFVGNIVLKFGEGFKSFLQHLLKQQAEKSLYAKIVLLMARNTLRKAMKSVDPQEYGGVPLLGVKGISIIGHGSSGPKAIKNMVLRAREMHQKRIVQRIGDAVKEYGLEKESDKNDQ